MRGSSGRGSRCSITGDSARGSRPARAAHSRLQLPPPPSARLAARPRLSPGASQRLAYPPASQRGEPSVRPAPAQGRRREHFCGGSGGAARPERAHWTPRPARGWNWGPITEHRLLRWFRPPAELELPLRGAFWLRLELKAQKFVSALRGLTSRFVFVFCRFGGFLGGDRYKT